MKSAKRPALVLVDEERALPTPQRAEQLPQRPGDVPEGGELDAVDDDPLGLVPLPGRGDGGDRLLVVQPAMPRVSSRLPEGAVLGDLLEPLLGLGVAAGVDHPPGDGREAVALGHEPLGLVRRAIAASTTGARRSALAARGGLVALLELGQHLAAEQLERLHDVLVAVLARLHHEDELVDARPPRSGGGTRGSGRACRPRRAGRSASPGGDLGAEALLLERAAAASGE